MAEQLSWLERNIHNVEVVGSSPPPVTNMYIKPEITVIKMEPTHVVCCSCTHNCIGTECGCGCKGWTDEKMNDFNVFEEELEND